MWWELSGDRDPEDPGSIITNVVRELGGKNGTGIEYVPNWLSYPQSQYVNLKNGFPGEGGGGY